MSNRWMRAGLAGLMVAGLSAAPAMAENGHVGYAPVMAAPVASWEGAEKKPAPDPKVAAGLAVGAPLAIGLSALVVPAMSEGGGMFLPVFVPLGLGAGHYYAGDPWRGLTVTGLGILGLGATFMAGVAAAFYERGAISWLSVPIFAAGTIGVFGWAAYDAHETAVRAGEP